MESSLEQIEQDLKTLRRRDYIVVKDYYLAGIEMPKWLVDGAGDVWTDDEVFDDFDGAWGKMKILMDSGVLTKSDKWWLKKNPQLQYREEELTPPYKFMTTSKDLSRKLPWRVEWL